MYSKVRTILVFFSFTALCSVAQPDNQYIFRHIDQSDGLLHNWVFSIVQDGKGFIWILTRNGLQRYDGSRFVNYPYDISNSGGIALSSGSALFADKKNNQLWMTSQRIEVRNLRDNHLTSYNTEQVLKNPSFRFETYYDSLNQPWLAGDLGVFPGDSSFKKMYPFYLTASYLMPNKSDPFFADKENGEAWFTRWGKGLLLFDKKTKRIYTHQYNPVHHPLLQLMDKKSLYYVFTDSRDNVWIASSGPEFYQYNYVTKKLNTYSLVNINNSQGIKNRSNYTLTVNCFFEDDHHVIWAGTQNAGLLKYDRDMDRFISIAAEQGNKNTIHYNYGINCLFQDNEQNIWMGTDKGITLFNPYRQYFQFVRHDESNSHSLPDYEVQQYIEARNGDIVAGTWGGGLTVFDNKWHFKKNIFFSRSPEEYNMPWSFAENDDGTIWVGCQHGYIHIYNPETGVIKTIHPPELNNYTIRCMVKDKQGNILMGLHNGRIAKWDKNEKKFYAYTENQKGIQQTFAPVFTIFIDNRQRCWAGTEYGLKQFDINRMIYSASYTPDKNNSYSLSAGAVLSIEDMDDSTLAIGTLYGGLNFFNKITKKISHLTAKDGLPGITINSLKRDKETNLWFTTDYGLYKYIPGNKKFIRYNIDPGIISSPFKSGNFYMLKDGRWLTGTATEIISFNPGSLQSETARMMKADITGFKVFDKTVYIDSFLYAGKPVRLSHKQNFISIEYGALSYSGLQEPEYYYQLSGVDKEWVPAGTKRFVSYSNLGPGEYSFHVKTLNEGEDEKITSFNIIITPPFWKTSWFRLLVLLSAVTVIYFLFRKRISTVRHEAEMKQKIAETEMMALRAQMNPHFIFNCINSIDAMIQSNDKYRATVYLNKFAKLIRNILDSSRQNLVPLGKDLETLKLYVELEQFRHENKFTSEIKIDDTLIQDDYKVPPLIIQPYVENAILHGLRNRTDNNGKLFIGVEKQNGCIRYTVQDNGAGRTLFADNGLEKKSYGMQMSSDRIKNFNNEEIPSVTVTDLKDEDKPAGTRVEVILKLK